MRGQRNARRRNRRHGNCGVANSQGRRCHVPCRRVWHCVRGNHHDCRIGGARRCRCAGAVEREECAGREQRCNSAADDDLRRWSGALPGRSYAHIQRRFFIVQTRGNARRACRNRLDGTVGQYSDDGVVVAPQPDAGERQRRAVFSQCHQRRLPPLACLQRPRCLAESERDQSRIARLEHRLSIQLTGRREHASTVGRCDERHAHATRAHAQRRQCAGLVHSRQICRRYGPAHLRRDGVAVAVNGFTTQRNRSADHRTHTFRTHRQADDRRRRDQNRDLRILAIQLGDDRRATRRERQQSPTAFHPRNGRISRAPERYRVGHFDSGCTPCADPQHLDVAARQHRVLGRDRQSRDRRRTHADRHHLFQREPCRIRRAYSERCGTWLQRPYNSCAFHHRQFRRVAHPGRRELLYFTAASVDATHVQRCDGANLDVERVGVDIQAHDRNRTHHQPH